MRSSWKTIFLWIHSSQLLRSSSIKMFACNFSSLAFRFFCSAVCVLLMNAATKKQDSLPNVFIAFKDKFLRLFFNTPFRWTVVMCFLLLHFLHLFSFSTALEYSSISISTGFSRHSTGGKIDRKYASYKTRKTHTFFSLSEFYCMFSKPTAVHHVLLYMWIYTITII